MPASVFDQWRAYYQAEPFGQPWENWLMAVPAHILATVHSKKGASPKMKDFFYEDPAVKKERQTKQFFHFLETYEPKRKH